MLDQFGGDCNTDLDEALNIIAKLGILYGTLPHLDQKELLRNVVERVILTPEGKIQSVNWLPPFAYLQELSDKVSRGGSFSKNVTGNQKIRQICRIFGVDNVGLEPTTFSTSTRCSAN